MNRILLLVACAALVAVVTAGDGTWEYALDTNTKFKFGPVSTTVVTGKKQFSSFMSADVTIPNTVHTTFVVSEMTATLDNNTYTCLPSASIVGKFKVTCSALQSSLGVTNPMGITICSALNLVSSEQEFSWSAGDNKGSGTFKLSDQFSTAIQTAMTAANTDVTFTVTQDLIMNDSIAMSLVAKLYAKPAGVDLIDKTVDLASTTLAKIGGVSDYFVDCQIGSNVGKKCLILGLTQSLTCKIACKYPCEDPQRTAMLASPASCPAPAAAGAAVVAAAAVGQMLLL